MGAEKIIIVAKIFDQIGCLAYRCKTAREAENMPSALELVRNPDVQIVVLTDPEIYMEYAPYDYVEDLQEFVEKVLYLNKKERDITVRAI